MAGDRSRVDPILFCLVLNCAKIGRRGGFVFPLLVIDRYHSHRRQQAQAALKAGQLQLCDELALLEPARLRPLARLSLWLLLGGGIVFGGLTVFVYTGLYHFSFSPSFGGIVLWCVLNILAYIAILPLHEAIHALAILFWGGSPHFGVEFLAGTRIPLALYCGAKQQLFRRNAYLTVALAPLLSISLGALVLTLLAPMLASYLLLATVGNISGAAGDLLVAWRLLRFPSHTLIEDTQTGYRAWQLTTHVARPESEQENELEH